VIFLENHGVIAHAESDSEAIALHEKVNDAIRQTLQIVDFPQPRVRAAGDGFTSATAFLKDAIEAIGADEAYFGALNALKARIKLGKGKVLQYSDANITFKHILKVDDEKKMQAFIDVFDVRGFNQLLKNLFKTYDISVSENPNYAFYLAYEIVDFIISAMRKKHADWFSEDLTKLFDLLAQNKIKPIIEARMPLAEAKRAHELIEQAEVQGKIVLTVAETAPRSALTEPAERG
jgi:hypothetical protein